MGGEFDRFVCKSLHEGMASLIKLVSDYYHAAELWIYSKTYTRKDLNVKDYAAYSKSEDDYQEKYVRHSDFALWLTVGDTTRTAFDVSTLTISA